MNMLFLDFIGSRQIGDGSGNAKYFVMSAGRKPHRIDSQENCRLSCFRGLTEFTNLRGCHLSVVMCTGAAESILLCLTSEYYFAPHLRTGHATVIRV